MKLRPKYLGAVPEPDDCIEPGIENYSELDLQQSLEYVEWLMRWYCRKPSQLLANIIIERLEKLKRSEDPGSTSDIEWSCSRLLKLWDYIVEENHGAARA